MELQASALSIVFFLVAFVCASEVALLVWAKPSRLSPPLDWLEGSFLALVSVLIFLVWAGVLLASFGGFSLGALSGILLVMAAGVFLQQRLPLVWPRFQPCTWREYLLLLLLLGCSFLYFRPHEYVLGGTDAGTYVNMGAMMARTGKFIQREPLLDFLSDYRAVTLREQPPSSLTHYLQFLGWYVDDNDPSRMIPQFFPFHPVLIAVGMQLGGLTGGLLVTPFAAVLGIAAFYLTVRRLFGAQAALIAACLLAIAPTHVYFSRYPTAELLTLLLVFTGMLAFQVSWDTAFADPLWGILGGAAFGAAFLTRIDLQVVFLCAVGFLLLWGFLRKRAPGWWAFALVLGCFSLHASGSALFLNWPYTWNTFGAVGYLLSVRPQLWIVLGFGFAGAVGALALLARWPARCESWLRVLIQSRWVRLALALGVLLLSAYAYFLRPVLEPQGAYTNWASESEIRVLDGLNWVRIGWYLTPLGLLLATLGIAWMFWSESLVRKGFFLATGLLMTGQYVYKAFIPEFHIYMMRRYVPIVIPTLVIGIAFVLAALFRRRGATRLLAGVLLVALTGGLLYQSRAYWLHRDGVGAAAQTSALASLLQDDALIIMTDPAVTLFADWWGVPLHFTFGYDVATIYQDGDQARELVQRLMQDAREAHRPVQLVARFSIVEALRESFYLEPVASLPVSLSHLMSTYDAYPTEIVTDTYTIEVYNVLEDPPDEMLTVDVGTMDVAFVDAGFYAKEVFPELTARWTSGEAVLEIPVTDAPAVIEVRAATYRPAELPPAEVTVLLDGQEIGRFTPGPTWQTYTFTGTAHSATAVSQLLFISPTFNLSQMGLSADDRDLGIYVDWVRVTAAE
ncbi:MAG: glycosyltransferase family 39 protein [Anaerolineae bacterium]|nr:glycosyltransferase family 39 protein [Anaerolineae bacterium]